jgi:hypothetical protein
VLRACKGILHQLLNRRRSDAGDLNVRSALLLQYGLAYVIADSADLPHYRTLGRRHTVSVLATLEVEILRACAFRLAAKAASQPLL